MEALKTCFYCLAQYSEKDNEHIFPDGLGGQRLMMDCVCRDCNQHFSRFEQELISKSFLSFVRLAETPTSVPAKQQFAMADARSLRIDNDLQVDLEVLVQNQLVEKLIAQIVLKDNLLHIRYEVKGDFEDLMESLKSWKENNLTFTAKGEGGKIYSWSATRDETNQTVNIETTQQPKKDYVGLIVSAENDNANEFLFPRIFLDAQGRLKIRARNQQESVELVKHLVWWNLETKMVIDQVIEGTHEISVAHSHDGVMFNRALVKIAMNALVACYPETKSERDKLLTAISFVTENIGKVPFVVTHAKTDLDTIAHTHNLFFHNYKNQTSIRISLYNGAFQIVFLLPKLDAVDINGPGRLVIDHLHKRNTFQNIWALNRDLAASDAMNFK